MISAFLSSIVPSSSVTLALRVIFSPSRVETFAFSSVISAPSVSPLASRSAILSLRVVICALSSDTLPLRVVFSASREETEDVSVAISAFFEVMLASSSVFSSVRAFFSASSVSTSSSSSALSSSRAAFSASREVMSASSSPFSVTSAAFSDSSVVIFVVFSAISASSAVICSLRGVVASLTALSISSCVKPPQAVKPNTMQKQSKSDNAVIVNVRFVVFIGYSSC